ncbi:MAG TPA: GNAT family N-acetyltransferase [Anaerolineales bacterium]|nr:GNAT family N-acetyltransferase [Anaerolineales bacterium]
MISLVPFTSTHYADTIRIWNAASHHDYPINERFLAYNVIPATGETIEGRVAIHHDEPVGLVLACAVHGGTLGWVSAIAVHPSAQRQSIGSELLRWAEDWLKVHDCKRIRIGGNLRPFLPGLPYVMRENTAFFEQRGYQFSSDQPYEYDIARSLKDYQPIYPKPANADLAPMNSREEHLLLDFLHCAYPGRWEFEAQEFVRNGGRASDFLLLRVNGDVQGFCRLTLADSERPIERFYPQRLPQPWGQYGPLGLSKAVRGQGLGGYLIDAAACHMRSLGVDGCVIDWTSLVELYGKFGFKVYNRYISLFKKSS